MKPMLVEGVEGIESDMDSESNNGIEWDSCIEGAVLVLSNQTLSLLVGGME
jgi:hypothetical protein